MLLLVLLAGGMFSSAHGALPHRDPRVQKQVESVENEWRQAQLSNDVTTMDKLLADDYIGIGANGTIQTKPETLAMHRNGTLHIEQLDLTDTRVRVYGDTAVVTSKATLTGTNGDHSMNGEYRYTRVYNRRSGQWKIVSFESSRMHDSANRAKH